MSTPKRDRLVARDRERRPADNVLAAIMEQHWAMLEEPLHVMLQIAQRENLRDELEALERLRGEQLDNTHEVTVRDGIATIPVEGPLIRRASFFQRISGATSYQDLALDFAAALDDPRIRAIILAIDSPGGSVNGNFEFADMVFAARGRKPVAAYVSHQGASAAYVITAAADVVVIDSAAILGSLGTVLSVRKPGPERDGSKTYEIVSSQSPKKRLDLDTPEGLSEASRTVDAIAGVLIQRVAQYRGTTVERVLAEFGAGGVFVGQAAIDAGLADRLGSYESLHAELRDRGPAAVLRSPLRAPLPVPGSSPLAASRTAMNQPAPTAPAAPAAPVAPTAPAAPDPAASAAPAAPVVPVTPIAPAPAAPVAAAPADPVTAERTRILAIQKLGRPGEEAVIAACIADATCTVEAAALRLRGAETGAATSRLAQLATDDGRGAPVVVPAPAAPAAAASASETEAAAILATHAAVTGGPKAKK
jgi:ClpP class serine protease